MGLAMQDFPRFEESHTFFDSDLDCTGRVGIARICDLLQAAATAHADLLGVGMHDLMKEGHTWMLSSMSVCFDRWPKAMDAVKITTWPSGVRGKIVCYRDYTIDAPDGARIARATSDWIYVDIENRRIDRLTPVLTGLAPEGVPRAGVEPAEKVRRPGGGGPAPAACDIVLRRADTDVNRHVNNVHYIEWLFEPMAESDFARRLLRLDISYRAEARMGDAVTSEVTVLEGGRTTLHALRRKADGAVLVSATCRWE